MKVLAFNGSPIKTWNTALNKMAAYVSIVKDAKIPVGVAVDTHGQQILQTLGANMSDMMRMKRNIS